MIDWTGNEVFERIKKDDLAIVYVYTPLCGTCQVAGKMLAVVEAAVPALQIGKADLNYVPRLATDYEIESVPCLLIFRNGQMINKIYAFQSVEYLYRELSPLVL
ncbi:MAG: thioredoxin family protein [Ectobacillus sp.]